jgi:ATP-binding cassette subfamily F protein uup
LSALPARIEALEAEHARLEAAVASPDFYKEGAEAIAQTLDRIASVEQELLDAYSRADELRERA